MAESERGIVIIVSGMLWATSVPEHPFSLCWGLGLNRIETGNPRPASRRAVQAAREAKNLELGSAAPFRIDGQVRLLGANLAFARIPKGMAWQYKILAVWVIAKISPGTQTSSS